MSTHPTHRNAAHLPAALERLLASAERFVPRLRRAGWRREWEGELAYAWRRCNEDDDRRGLRRLWFRALWAHVDALCVRSEEISMTRFLADLKLAARSLRRTPTFTVVAVLTLTLGIAANTAIFSVVNGVLLRPLPYDEPDRLLSVNFTMPGAGYDIVPFSEDIFLELSPRVPSLEALGMYQSERFNLIGDGEPERVDGVRATPSVLSLLRVRPHLGRLLTDADARPGAEPVAMVAYELWQRRWGGDEGLLGTLTELDGRMRRIVGILPPGFAFPGDSARIWTPMIVDPANPSTGNFSNPGVGRLAAGRTLADAEADVAAAIALLPEIRPDDYPPALLTQIQMAPRIVSWTDLVVGDVRQALWVVLGTVGLVLLVACANVANLFLVRAESRQREVTLRSALGAGRGDIARFFLTESLMLSLSSGLLALVVAMAAVRAFVAMAPVAIPRLDQVTIDARVLGFNFVAALVAGLLFGSVPLWRQRSAELATQLRDGARGATAGNGAISTRNALVVAQVALALVLLVGSGLMLRSFQSLRTIDPGFSAEGVLSATLQPAGADYPEAAERVALWTELIDALETIPGAVTIGAINHPPLGEGRSGGSISIEDHPVEEGSLPPLAEKKRASPGYFQTLGIPLLAGRDFTADDGATNFRAAVVSESFATHWWPNESPLGRRVREGDDELGEDGKAADNWYEIVGVVGNVHYLGLELPAEEVVYFPVEAGTPSAPDVPGSMTVLLRSEGDPMDLTGPLRAAVRRVAPRIPVTTIQPMARVLDDAMARTSFTVVMLGLAAACALFLGAIGIYGVISYLVSQRTQEIGVRIALGAPAASVRRMVVRRGMILTGAGILAGLAAAVGLSSVLSALLYEVSATDPVTYVGVAAVLALTAFLACWLPARRAAAVDPVVALRGD